MKISLGYFSYAVLTTFVLGLVGASAPSGKTQDVELRIGIVQRFGEKPTQQLQLESTKGDRLKLSFKIGDKDQTVVTANPVKLEIAMQQKQQPQLEEKLVLGTYRTYETAEDSAQNWRKKGIEVEIAQPERWQVWAKRDVYSTPFLRRLLLESLETSKQKNTAFIDTQILAQRPRVTWVANNKRYYFSNLEISSGKNLIKVNQGKTPETVRLYPGRLELQPNAYGTYTLVNEVPLETYLRGVVPYEIGINAPTAALEAQAVIARTYVLSNLRRFAVDGYQLCADTHCQVYYGLKGVAPSTDSAIASTRGMVLTFQNQLVDALYSSTTGGVTASFSDVWNGEDRPYLRPVIDTANDVWQLSGRSLASEENFLQFISLDQEFNESGEDLFRWRKESSLEDITKGLQKFLRVKNSPFAKLKKVEEMEVKERSSSGRILKLDVKTDIGTFSLYKDEVRSAFAAPKSTLFYLQPLNKGKPGLWGYAFVGGGFGHGVGLSQIGAQNLAKLGWSSQKILQFYYPGTQIQALNRKRE
jgi:SpoIID/LytB domain protein